MGMRGPGPSLPLPVQRPSADWGQRRSWQALTIWRATPSGQREPVDTVLKGRGGRGIVAGVTARWPERINGLPGRGEHPFESIGGPTGISL
jgi:hypothetical protein